MDYTTASLGPQPAMPPQVEYVGITAIPAGTGYVAIALRSDGATYATADGAAWTVGPALPTLPTS